MKRRIAAPPIDYAQDRARWLQLILQAHQAVADDTPEARSRLAEAGIKARDIWTPPAPYPSGLLCIAFAQLAYAWGRQTDAGLRAGARDALIQSAGLADEVIQAVVAAPPIGDRASPAPVTRLPYADV